MCIIVMYKCIIKCVELRACIDVESAQSMLFYDGWRQRPLNQALVSFAFVCLLLVFLCFFNFCVVAGYSYIHFCSCQPNDCLRSVWVFCTSQDIGLDLEGQIPNDF